MRRHHLRFGAAETPAERARYHELYPLLRRQRDGLASHGSGPVEALAGGPVGSVDR
jgi:hypothetical protein